MLGEFEILLHVTTFVLSLILMGFTFAAVLNISPYQLFEDIIVFIKARRRRNRQNEGGEEEELNSLIELDEQLSRALQHLDFLEAIPFIVFQLLLV